jgi:hypothetical protein
MSTPEVVRKELLALLRGGNAHMDFDELTDRFAVEDINRRSPEVPYTPWQLVEHMRIAQWDILEFVRDPDHVTPSWPEGFWPPREEEADAARWVETLNSFRSDLQALQDMVADPETDFFAPIPHAPDYTIFREILLAADHNAYHMGELGMLRQILGAWPPPHEA